MSAIFCPQCSCGPEEHWPEHGKPTTACATCLDALIYTESGGGREGICCWPAFEIRRHADNTNTSVR